VGKDDKMRRSTKGDARNGKEKVHRMILSLKSSSGTGAVLVRS